MPEQILSASQFDQVLKSNTIVIVDFYADWCAPCKTIAPIYQRLSDKHSKDKVVIFTKVNVDQQQQIARQYGVTAMPTFMIFRNSAVIETIRGANARELTEVVESAVANKAPPPSFASAGRTVGEMTEAGRTWDFPSLPNTETSQTPSRSSASSTWPSVVANPRPVSRLVLENESTRSALRKASEDELAKKELEELALALERSKLDQREQLRSQADGNARTANLYPDPVNSRNTPSSSLTSRNTSSSVPSSSNPRDPNQLSSLFADRAARFTNTEASIRQAEIATKKAVQAAEQQRLKERRARLERMAKEKPKEGDSKEVAVEKVRAKAVMEAEKKKKEDAKEKERVMKLIEDDKERRRLEKLDREMRRVGRF